MELSFRATASESSKLAAPLKEEWRDENKAEYLAENFGRIAKKYDLFNDITTFGMHRLWKRDIIHYFLKFARNPKDEPICLDLCCGTGDITLLISRRLTAPHGGHVTGLDFSEGMLSVAAGRPTNSDAAIAWVNGDASDLKNFASNSLDLVTMGFGLRNIVNREKALSEIHRVLKPAGLFINLDLGKVRYSLLRPLANLFFYYIVPFIGRLIYRNDHGMFSYLPNSNDTYYSQADLTRLLHEKGFSVLKNQDYVFGQTTLHVAQKM